MTDSARDTAAEAPESLQPLLGTLDLLSDAAAGYCSGGVCHFPAPSVEKAE
ncbi:MAG: hypothetical protein JF592_08265 [Microbacterium sp.]|uniref:hypothetical protein n=1 Tax=Microbacterium sp. TaxID=51671 RepID=UPI001D3CA041|nr:hypothetical protein [Microbacterium sp.]MBW8762567.1 hypothetical protein [Microbacterium sp.]